MNTLRKPAQAALDALGDLLEGNDQQRPLEDVWNDLRAALSEPQPELAEFVLVPREPTPEMVGAMAVEESTGTINGISTLGMAGACLAWESALAAAPQVRQPPTIEAAHEMGAKGGPIDEGERLAFEAWMRGHCWALSSTWDGKQYRSDAEQGGDVDPRAMGTRRLWAAWRDRAALARS